MNSGVTLFGLASGHFVRTVRMCLEEKQLPYALEEYLPHSREIRRLNLLGKTPALRHGEFVLYESSAIARYVDEGFDGPPLQPPNATERATMNQWIGAICDSFDTSMMQQLVHERLVVPADGGVPDEAIVRDAMPRVQIQLAIADKALAQHNFLAGRRLTLADLFLAPMIDAVKRTEEGAGLLEESFTWLNRWCDRMAARRSFHDTATIGRQ
ncbi:MAG: glutathione S-transferase family protein [Gammaproteobacteria bacterium]|nr:glutathione S-transferase family protein [Gammaproteobacteria bacterium]